MPDTDQPAALSAVDVAASRQRRLVAAQLQAIEGNPLDAEQAAMFEMFERECWPHERRRAYMRTRYLASAAE
jgi:hypothetical protein